MFLKEFTADTKFNLSHKLSIPTALNIKAEFLANYLFQFNRLVIVGDLDCRASKRYTTCQ